ncbi:hypothetical protein ACJRO7_033963 [Eucalyptus globulus]|uniref:Uncharacterized protein n=1 Tax=Eucalyptus globulus TaxID=34317 RepID=A0ABD3J4Y5_EUCGL
MNLKRFTGSWRWLVIGSNSAGPSRSEADQQGRDGINEATAGEQIDVWSHGSSVVVLAGPATGQEKQRPCRLSGSAAGRRDSLWCCWNQCGRSRMRQMRHQKAAEWARTGIVDVVLGEVTSEI